MISPKIPFLLNFFILSVCRAETISQIQNIYHVPNGNGSYLKELLIYASPGDGIELDGSEFEGPFHSLASGNATHPITIYTSSEAQSQSKIISGLSGQETGLSILGSYWTIKSLEISGFHTGLLLRGDRINVENVIISDVAYGVNIKGTGNVVDKSSIMTSKLGIQIQGLSRNTNISETFINGSLNAIDASKFSCCGVIMGKEIYGSVNLYGPRYRFNGLSVNGTDEVVETSPKQLNYFVVFLYAVFFLIFCAMGWTLIRTKARKEPAMVEVETK